MESIHSPLESRPPSQCTSTNASELDIFSPTPCSSSKSLPPRNSNKKRNMDIDNVITSVGKRLNEARTEDRHDAFGRNVSHKLRILPNEQRIYLEKLINDGIFEAELGNLSRHSYIYIPPSGTQTLNMAAPSIQEPSPSNFGNMSSSAAPPSAMSRDNINPHQNYNSDYTSSNLSTFISNYTPNYSE